VKNFLSLIACVVLGLGSTAAFAQPAYPSRPIHFVIGFPPGGVVDILARTLADKMSEAWKQPVIVDNRPGATGAIAANIVAKAQADGYTILMTAPISHAIVAVLNAPLPYHPERDFVPVSEVADLALVLVVHPSLPVSNVQDLIALAKEKPNQITYGSAGIGAMQHIATELFSKELGIKLVHVPYKGSAPELLDLVAGRIKVSIDNPQTVLPRVKSGQLRALAVTSKDPWFAAPDLPTIGKAAGVPGFDFQMYWGVVAPAGTPKDIVSALNAQIVRILNEKEVRDRLAAQGVRAAPSTPEEFGRMIHSAFTTWTPEMVEAAGMKKK
jgi:tripartite-type tricarboxylate transporter receptor subunit TctC